MSRPKNRDEYRRGMAEAFADVLEEKGLEWRKDWTDGGAPRNGVTKAFYRGSNAFWLSLIASKEGYDDPRWVTMVQIMDRDQRSHPKERWHLKAGSKAAYVEYWYPYDLRSGKAVTWDSYRSGLRDGRGQDEFRLSARYTAVFNACDIEGMPELEATRNNDIEMDKLVSRLSENMGVQIILDGGSWAFYSPVQDRIHLPGPESFDSEYSFNAAALHELAHSTGHPKRLGRPGFGTPGSAGYAYEELVAEMSSCFMGFDLKTGPDSRHVENHRAYVRSWIDSIRGEPGTLIRAVKDAQNAANYMDWKAGLITDMEYDRLKSGTVEIRNREKDRSDAR